MARRLDRPLVEWRRCSRALGRGALAIGSVYFPIELQVIERTESSTRYRYVRLLQSDLGPSSWTFAEGDLFPARVEFDLVLSEEIGTLYRVGEGPDFLLEKVVESTTVLAELEVEATQIPEPSAGWLLAMSLLWVGGAGLRRSPARRDAT